MEINDLSQLKDPQRIMTALRQIFAKEDYLQVFRDVLSKYNLVQRKSLLIQLAIELDQGISQEDFPNLENDLKRQRALFDKNEWLQKSNHKSIPLQTALNCFKLARKKLREKHEFNE